MVLEFMYASCISNTRIEKESLFKYPIFIQKNLGECTESYKNTRFEVRGREIKIIFLNKLDIL